jgi:hypothetical protein
MPAFAISAFVFCLVALPLVGTYLERRQAGRVGLRRSIGRMKTTAIAALQAGERAKVCGVVTAREPLVTSPISGRDCVGYRVVIDDTSHDPTLSWDPVVSREAWPSFLVTDETGPVAVQGPLEMLVWPCSGGETLPAGASALLAADGVRMWDLLRRRTFWFRETLLKVGDRVRVVGRPSLEIDPAGRGSFREPPRLQFMRGTLDEPVVVLDEDDHAAGERVPGQPRA